MCSHVSRANSNNTCDANSAFHFHLFLCRMNERYVGLIECFLEHALGLDNFSTYQEV